jgi:CubicO group peptidase (beta-lactamase class C family)
MMMHFSHAQVNTLCLPFTHTLYICALQTFKTVSIWQLHERGKLDVTQPFTRYANTTALGLPRNWCPRLANANGTAVGACLAPPTIEQLLRMSGGIVDAGVTNSRRLGSDLLSESSKRCRGCPAS